MPRHGSVLVAVLFVLSALGVAALSLSYRASVGMRQSRQDVLRVQLHAQARSAARIAIARLLANADDFDHRAEAWHTHRPLLSEDWLPAWQGPFGRAGDFRTEYFVLDEESKLHIANLSSDMMTKFGMSDEQAAALMDWIDADDVPRSGGAESEYYRALPAPYACKNAPLETLDELVLVRGFDRRQYMGDDIAARLDASWRDAIPTQPPRLGWVSLLTCCCGGKININTAPAEVLAALPISPQAVRQIVEFRRFDESTAGALEPHVFRSAQDIEQLNGLTAAEKDVLKALCRFNSKHFRIFVLSVHSPSGARVELEALVRVEAGVAQVLQWKT